MRIEELSRSTKKKSDPASRRQFPNLISSSIIRLDCAYDDGLVSVSALFKSKNPPEMEKLMPSLSLLSDSAAPEERRTTSALSVAFLTKPAAAAVQPSSSLSSKRKSMLEASTTTT